MSQWKPAKQIPPVKEILIEYRGRREIGYLGSDNLFYVWKGYEFVKIKKKDLTIWTELPELP